MLFEVHPICITDFHHCTQTIYSLTQTPICEQNLHHFEIRQLETWPAGVTNINSVVRGLTARLRFHLKPSSRNVNENPRSCWAV